MIVSGIKNSSINTIKIKYANVFLKLFLISISIIWIIGFLQPILLPQTNPLVNFLSHRIYSLICHQEELKCINLGNESILVCARCTGIYFGILISALLMLFRNTPLFGIKEMLIASAPLLLDVLLSTFEIYTYSKGVAFGTGLIFGSMICLFLLSELENLFSYKSISRNE